MRLPIPPLQHVVVTLARTYGPDKLIAPGFEVIANFFLMAKQSHMPYSGAYFPRR
jgi:hypothetical protein